MRRRQRTGKIPLGRADAPSRQALDARRGAERRHRRLRPLVPSRWPLLRLRGQSLTEGSRGLAKETPPDYSNPGGPVQETTVPASKASIQAIASLHALVTLALLDDPAAYAPGFTSLLLTFQRVPKCSTKFFARTDFTFRAVQTA